MQWRILKQEIIRELDGIIQHVPMETRLLLANQFISGIDATTCIYGVMFGNCWHSEAVAALWKVQPLFMASDDVNRTFPAEKVMAPTDKLGDRDYLIERFNWQPEGAEIARDTRAMTALELYIQGMTGYNSYRPELDMIVGYLLEVSTEIDLPFVLYLRDYGVEY